MRSLRPLPSRLYAPIAGSLIGLTIAGAGAGFAATLGVDTEQLTVFQKASTIPVTTCTLTPSADSYVDQELTISGVNFGTTADLDVRAAAGGQRYTFVRFNIGSCGILATAAVQTADLALFLFDAPPSNRTYNLHRVTAQWTEDGITWDNQPGIAANATASVATGTADNVTLTHNVFADVTNFVAGTQSNEGWRVSDTEITLLAVDGQFRSREAAGNHPTLTITYYP